MPLAISQAAAYIQQRKPRVTVSKYLKDVQQSEKNKASLLNIAIRDRRRDRKVSNSILATWQISFEYIQTARSSAARLLSLMSFFDRQEIPEELITSEYEEDDGVSNFDEDIEMLRNYSLVITGVENNVFDMHRLVQFATKTWLKEHDKLEKWKESYITIIAEALPSGKYENWKKCQLLFPHAELALEYQPTNKDFVQQWTTVLTNAGWYAREQARYDKAETMNRRALDGSEKALGKEHSSTLTSVSNLALVLQDQGKYEEAETMNRRALDGSEKALGKEHPSTLTSVSNLASVLQDQGKYEEAEMMNRRALDGREKALGKEHPSTLTSVYCLAYLLHQQQRYVIAEPLYERALAGYDKVLGSDHPTTKECSKHYASLSVSSLEMPKPAISMCRSLSSKLLA